MTKKIIELKAVLEQQVEEAGCINDLQVRARSSARALRACRLLHKAECTPSQLDRDISFLKSKASSLALQQTISLQGSLSSLEKVTSYVFA